MWVRMTSMRMRPEAVEEAKRIYRDEVLPVARQQKGIVDMFLLEPAEPGGEYVSCTVWESEEDARAYEDSGTYRMLVDKASGAFAGTPSLRSYRAVVRLKAPASAPAA